MWVIKMNKRPNISILIGLPGSGKSTYALSESIEGIYLSSDKIRKELYGDESIQGNPEDIFGLMQYRALSFLRKGIDVIYDATNIVRKDRVTFISKLPKDCFVTAKIIWQSIEKCIENDFARERTVGKQIIERMAKRFQAPWYDEGFDSIEIHRNFSKQDFENYTNKVFEDLDIPHDNSHHVGTIKEHSLSCYKNMLNLTNEEVLIEAAKYHDIGKPFCKSFKNTKGEDSIEAHYYDHQNVGAWMSYGLSRKNTFYRAWLINHHMAPFLNAKYLKTIPDHLKEDILLLHEADKNAC